MRETSFSEVVTDVTSKFKKIKQSDYKKDGLFQIIDQGKEHIAGYTDDEELANGKLPPIIIFGDHTRVFKYVETPIALGADGAKALWINPKIANSRYVFFYLKSVKLSDAGYSRHFKFLKELKIPIPYKDGNPALDDQIRIATLLSRVETLIAARKDNLRLLEEFLKSTFLEIFGDPVRNEKEWEIDELVNLTTKIGSGATPTGGNSSYKLEGITLIRSMNVHDNRFEYKELAFIDAEQAHKLRNVIVEVDDVLLNITGASVCRCCILPKDVIPARV